MTSPTDPTAPQGIPHRGRRIALAAAAAALALGGGAGVAYAASAQTPVETGYSTVVDAAEPAAPGAEGTTDCPDRSGPGSTAPQPSSAQPSSAQPSSEGDF